MEDVTFDGKPPTPPIPRRKRLQIEVREDGSLVIPPDLARRIGLAPGATVPVDELDNHLVLRQPVSLLAKVYLEPTNDCQLACATCMRGSWDDPIGRMEPRVFDRILEGMQGLPSIPAVFFGGIGEPLAHPGAPGMLRQVKALGARTELITNGLALDERMIRELLATGLDLLWVSLDGASPECYGETREARALPEILSNLRLLRSIMVRGDARTPELGIAFVGTKRNAHELADVMRLGRRLGATRFSISNVQPHTPELGRDILYGRTAGQSPGAFTHVDLARMDGGGEWDHEVAGIIADCGLHYADGRVATRAENACPFIERGSTSIRWDGIVSPCLPLLHSHEAWLGPRRRQIREHSFGSVTDRSLGAIWNDEAYVAFRRRVQDFDFPPCVRCNSCDWIDSNQEDCFRSPPPACGGCLWAQGFIQCP
jgi:MoaA/NifB/PqqE/SkfB family radical SAM enzyme